MKKSWLLLFVGLVTLECSAIAETADEILGGRKDAPIRIEIFSDFQCPSCRALYLDSIKPVLKDYASKDKVCVIYHEFPLIAIHRYAFEAARYSVAAQKLGRQKWGAVVDALYTQQQQWAQSGKIDKVVSSALGFDDFQKVMKILKDPTISEAINRDIALGNQRRVRSTPTMFLSAIGKEQRVEGPIPYPVLKDFFDHIVK